MDLSFDATDLNYASSLQDGGGASNNNRSSDESGDDGFSFAAAAASNPRKNLTAMFEEQVVHPATVKVQPSVLGKGSSSTSTISPGAAVSSSSTSQEEIPSSSVKNRIAHFEAASHVSAAAAITSKPPLPLKLLQNNSNLVPANRLAVYLRIRPTNDAASTIQVLKPKHPYYTHPTTVRTYPPADSNATKIHSHRSSSHNSQEFKSHAKQFEFHQVLTPQTTQKDVYNRVATPLLQELFDSTFQKVPENKSALLFSYGITNAGKTHTILGDLKSNDDDDKWGILPRAISDILDRKKQMPKVAGQELDLYMSFFEIYNENVYDLVPKRNTVGGALPESLKVRERQGQTIVRGLAKHKIDDVPHGIQLTVAANQRRHTSSNNLNADSSRSHCVCQMQLIPRQSISTEKDDSSVIPMNGYSTDEDATRQQNVSCTIWIVDLAGSERSKRTQMGLARQKEASQINKSLMTLMRCLTVMRTNGSARAANGSGASFNTTAVIPFRESKLTHVFMGHLTGSSAARTAMIVNVNPSMEDFDETQHVLGYASSAKLIQLDPKQLQEIQKMYSGKQANNDRNDEYGLDGHKKIKNDTSTGSSNKDSSARGGLVKVLKGLSPKKWMKRAWGGNPEKRKLPPARDDKKKLVKQSSASSFSVNSNHSHHSVTSEPAMKRHRVEIVDKRPTIPVVVPQPYANGTNSAIAFGNVGIDPSAEFKLTKEALAEATRELDKLRSEKEELLDELVAQESQIRLEVSQEMEERLRLTRERHRIEVERLRAQIPNNTSLLESTAKRDHAERHLEELMDKVDECEEEIQLLRRQHERELASVKKSYDAEVSRLQSELAARKKGEDSEKRVADLESQLEASKNQVERLKRSKLEIVENYEKLLEDERNQGNTNESSPEDDSDEEELSDVESEDEEDEGQDEENQIPLWKQKLTRCRTRQVLGPISSNTPAKKAASDNPTKGVGITEQWIFPKAASAQETDGLYRRPSGRALSGREWDATVGGWKLVN